MRKDKTITLLQAYDKDMERFMHRVGKDRSEHSLRSMQQGRQYVAAFLTDWMHTDDIQLAKLMPQFIHDFSVYLSTDRGLRGGTIWLACQLLKGVVTRAHARGLLEWNPFGQFHIAKNIRPREYLTEEEIAELEQKIRNAKIIDEAEIDTKTVQIGNLVKLLDIEFNEV